MYKSGMYIFFGFPYHHTKENDVNSCFKAGIFLFFS